MRQRGRGTAYCADCGKPKLGRTIAAARCLACDHRATQRRHKAYSAALEPKKRRGPRPPAPPPFSIYGAMAAPNNGTGGFK